jgi:hypothetical protein
MKRYVFLIALFISSGYPMEKEDRGKGEKKDYSKGKEKYPTTKKNNIDSLKKETRRNSEPMITPAVSQPENPKSSLKTVKAFRRLSGDLTALFNKRDTIKQDEGKKIEGELMTKMEKASSSSPRTKEKILSEILETPTDYFSPIKSKVEMDKVTQLIHEAEIAINNMEEYSKAKNEEEMVVSRDIFLRGLYKIRPLLIDIYKMEHPELASKEHEIQWRADQNPSYKNLFVLYEEMEKRIEASKKRIEADKGNV